MHRSAYAAPATLLTLLLLVAGCSDEPSSDSDGPSTGSSGSSAGSRAADALAPCTTEPTSTGLFTTPGQVLCFGTAAVLPIYAPPKDADVTGRMQLVVTGIERGDDALIDREITPGMSEWTSQSRDLWFARAEARLLSEKFPGAMERVGPFDILSTVRSTEGESGEATAPTPVTGCESQDFEDGAGKPFATCTWSVLPTGVTAYSVFWGDTGDYGRDGIVWAPE